MHARWFLPLFLLLALRPLSADETRSERVIASFRDLVHARAAAHYNARDAAPLSRIECPELGETVLCPRVPPGCGMVTLALLPRERAVALARRLFEAYGYRVRDGYPIEREGVRGVVDLYDEEARVGFEIVSGIPSPWLPTQGTAETEPEPPDEGLSADEIRTLRKSGAKIHAVPLGHFADVPADDLDPLLACLAGTVEFLNRVTDGEDVDLGGIVAAEDVARKVKSVTGSAVPAGKSFPDEKGYTFFPAKHAGRVVVEVGGGEARRVPGPRLVVLPTYRAKVEPGLHFVLEQERKGGSLLRVRSDRAVFLAPPEFDPARSFRVVIDLPAGAFELGDAVRIR